MLVPKDNMLRQINDLVDFTFVYLEGIGFYQLHHITAVEIANFYEYIQNRKST